MALASCIVQGQVPVAVPEAALLLRPDGTPFQGMTGGLAVSGNTAVVGVPADNQFGLGVGAAYVFERQTDGRWMQTAVLQPAGAQSPCYGFGTSVAVQGDVILIRQRAHEYISPSRGCAPYFQAYGDNVHVFEHGASGWSQTNFLSYNKSLSVDLDGAFAVIGRKGGADVYERVAPGTWIGPQFLPQVGIAGGDTDFLGVNAAISGHRIVLGTLTDAERDLGRSASYLTANVYEHGATGQWQLAANLVTYKVRLGPDHSSPQVSIAGNTVSIGGLLFEGNPFGYWDQVIDASVQDATPGPQAVVVFAGSTDALVTTTVHTVGDSASIESLTRTDLFRRNSRGEWEATARLDFPADTTEEKLPAGSTLHLLRAGQNDHVMVYGLDAGANRHSPRLTMPVLLTLPPHTGVALAGNPVQLHVSASDYNYDGSGIASVEFRVGAGPWQAMTPIDGAYGERFESARADFPAGVSAVTPTGETRVCLRVTDRDGSRGETLDREWETCPLLEILNWTDFYGSTDRLAPEVTGVVLFRDEVFPGQDNKLFAFADDTDRGASKIRSMQYLIDDGLWRPMKPLDTQFMDGSFDEGYTLMPIMTESGVHRVCVRAIDAQLNESAAHCTSFRVLD